MGPDAPVEKEANDIDVSDLDSDLEPDQLIPAYLKIKGKLFEIDPDSVEVKTTKQSKGSKARNGQGPKSTPTAATRKLLCQLSQLESDALFDRYEAESQWPAKRSQIAQAKAAAKRDQVQEEIPSPLHPQQVDLEQSPPTEAQESEGEEPNLLGDMFSQPDQSSGPTSNSGP